MRTSSGEAIGSRSNPIPAAIYQATRSLLRVSSTEEAVAVIVLAVRQLGGDTSPARSGHPDALPLDISLGEGEPLIVTARCDSDARRQLEEFVPQLRDDARLALNRSADRLAREAGVDSLTGLPNRRTLVRIVTRLKNGDCLVMLDLDHFDEINDTHGRDAGDDLLRGFSRALRHTVRATDHFGRMGPEEFLVILRDADVSAAGRLMTRLRRHWLTVRPLSVSFSAGIAQMGTRNWRQTMRAVDLALLRAKEAGRDRWETTEDSDHTQPDSPLARLTAAAPPC